MIYCEDCSSYDCGCPEANEIKSLRQQLASRDAEIAELVTALEKLACLGNGDRYGNSIGNCIAQDALAKARKP